MLSINDRVIYDGKKATVIQTWKKMVRILTAEMEKMNVPIADLVIADGQLELLDTTRYEKPQAGFTDWEIDTGGIDDRERAIGPTEESGLRAIDSDDIDSNPSLAEKMPPVDPNRDPDLYYCDLTPKFTKGDLVMFQGKPYRVTDIGEYQLYEDDDDRSTYSYGYCLQSEDGRRQFSNTIAEFFLAPIAPGNPDSVDPNPDPNSVDPNPDPNSVDPNSVDPNSVDPNPDPNSVDPNPVDPNHPAKGYEEIKILKGGQYRYWRWYEDGKKRSKYLGPVNPIAPKKSPQAPS